MGRPRSAGRRDLPPNLHPHSSGQFRYLHPGTGKPHYLGRDRAAAIEAATQLNAILVRRVSLVDKVAGAAGKPLADVLEWFKDERIKKLKLAAKTEEEKNRMTLSLRAACAGEQIGEMDVLACSELLDRVAKPGSRSREIYRTLLVQVFNEAGAKGWATDNPAARTLSDDPEKQRLPLTLEWFNLIREKAERSMQLTMDLALHTLQRREDISTMGMPRDGRIDLVQQKTGAALSIEVTSQIQQVIDGFLELGVICPFIVRMKPKRAMRSDRRGEDRQHFAQLVPEQISRGFADARDQVEIFQQMAPAKRPTFHEIRGLGGKLYRELMGWSEAQVQGLMGHADVEMTREYLGHHAPTYERVTAGLKLG